MRITTNTCLWTISSLLAGTLIWMTACERSDTGDPGPGPENPVTDSVHYTIFPPFITPVEDYFDLSISSPPDLDSATYQLEITGLVDDTVNLSLQDLRMLEMVERPLTIECIENYSNGNLVATATWKGFRLYDLLRGLGIRDEATMVKYSCADGYYTYNSLEELQNYDVIGALYMNGRPIPQKFGFPLRILFPGYYGVRQPGWVDRIEVLDSDPEDFWSVYGWDTDSAMHVDSKIFFPQNGERFALGDTIKVGGAAFGPRRIAAIEITIDGGNTWIPTEIVRETDHDFVWVFWEASIRFPSAGAKHIYSRARSADGRVQPFSDQQYLDGTNAWPSVRISVLDPE